MYEDCIRKFISENVSPGHTVFDIGANQGLYTSEMAVRVGHSGTVHAFEANPAMAQVLAHNNSAKNVFVHPIALSADEGIRKFYIDIREGVGAVASSLNVLDDLHEKKLVKEISVQTSTIDLICQRNNVMPNFIKIDVEGHELEVFRGSVNIINKYRPVMVFEFWETWWDKGIRHIFEFLAQSYKLVRLQDGKDVEKFYYEQKRHDVVDIGCLPLQQARHQPMNLQYLI
ncbi:FkbM family methyltransferase [Nitrospira sp. M1]